MNLHSLMTVKLSLVTVNPPLVTLVNLGVSIGNAVELIN